jgi:Fe-S cluster assembly iron-binding protein IscA
MPEREDSMVTSTETALTKLKAMELKEEEFLRIDAEVAGRCGLSVKFSLVFDESRRYGY